MSIDLSRQNEWHRFNLKQYPRGKDFPGTITNSCNHPRYALSIDSNGDCFICVCEAWVPIPVGNILDFNSLEEVWLSPIAQEIQKDVDDKKFTYCAVSHCGVADTNKLLTTYYITVSMDVSCNLACPSCRSKIRNITEGPEFDHSKKLIDHFVTLIQKFDHPTQLVMTGNGDVLASVLYRPLVLNWQPLPNHKIILRTNGLLMKKLLPDSPVLPYISEFQISMDAGTAEVYENVRRPGKHKVLIENLDWLLEYRNTQTPRPEYVFDMFSFVLQAANAADIVNFVNLCKKYNAIPVISKLDNWGAQVLSVFNTMELTKSHPLFKTAMDQLIEAKTIDPRLRIGSLIEQQLEEYIQTLKQ